MLAPKYSFGRAGLLRGQDGWPRTTWPISIVIDLLDYRF